MKPDSSAVRVALWRALHLEIDPPPHVLEDTLASKLAEPEEGWRDRPDMNPQWTARNRASIVARARFVEDRVADFDQYVILGAGLDTFAQRKPGKQVFEIDRPETQAWKRQRLVDLGLPAPTFVPVDFEKQDWWDELVKAGFDPRGRSIVSSLGVSMYITKEATKETLERIAKTPATLILSFIVPMDLVEESERPMFEIAQKGARASGTPMIAFYAPDEMLALAREAGFGKVEHVSGADLARLYFADRPDGLRPPLMGESLLVASI